MLQIVDIDWLDSAHGGGWQALADAERMALPIRCKTVGYLVCEDGVSVTVATTLGLGDKGEVTQTCDCMTIPKVAITGRRTVKTGRRGKR